MTRTVLITRASTYRLTGVAVVLFLVLCWAFGDGLLTGPPSDPLRTQWLDSPIITYLLLALIVLAGVVQARRLPDAGLTLRYPRDEAVPGQAAEPVFAKLLFGNVFWALLWLPLRFFVGREWLSHGLAKVDNPAWMDNGEALAKFWQGAVAVDPSGEGQITYDWYRGVLQYMLDGQWHGWFAKLVVLGEILVGLGLLLGGLAGLASFLGTFMNFNYGLAGTASSNPILMGLGLLLVLAWRTVGFWGLDRWLLPLLGTPWQPGAAFEGEPYPAGEAVDPTLPLSPRPTGHPERRSVARADRNLDLRRGGRSRRPCRPRRRR